MDIKPVNRPLPATCSTCRHWDAADNDTETDYRTEDCDDVPIVHKRCQCPLIVDVSSKLKFYDVPLDGAGFHDVEGYRATLRTGPGFGCVHHEARAEVVP